jgi:phosphoserine phosphatase
MAEIKCIFFDMEGTIFRKAVETREGRVAPSAWTMIGRKLGEEADKEEEETKNKWNRGEYSGYVEWMEDTIKVHKKYGLTKEKFDWILGLIEYHFGVKETFAELRKKGYKTAMISGGFKAQADRAQKDLFINHAFAACEYFWDKDGKLLHWNLLPCDYEGKLDFMNLIIKEHGLKADECAFVGDGKNDIMLAKSVGLSIAFNAPLELQKVCTHAVNQEEGKEDFRAILKFLS